MFIAHVILSVHEADRPLVINRLSNDAGTVLTMEGCLAFTPFVHPTDPHEVGILHEWRSAEDFAKYISSDTFTRFQKDVLSLAVTKPISRRFHATLIEAAD